MQPVRRYLRDEQAGRYGPRSPRPTKLDAFKPYVMTRIEAARPRCIKAARRSWIPAVVLLREIRERGYEGEGHHRWNKALLCLTDEFGFQPRLCRPYPGAH